MYSKELTEEHCQLTFDPTKAKDPVLREVFNSPKATALWLGYRLWHIIDQYGEEWLPKNSLAIAKQIDESIFIQAAMRSWSDTVLAEWLWPQMMRGLHLGASHMIPDSIAYVRFVRPYLTGESS